jgi:hypothetical protein
MLFNYQQKKLGCVKSGSSGIFQKITLILSIMLPAAVSANASGLPVSFNITSDEVQVIQQAGKIGISLYSPQFEFESGIAKTGLCRINPGVNFEKGEVVEIPCEPISLNDSDKLETAMMLQWSSKENVLRKWAKFRLSGINKPVLLKEVILEKLEIKNQKVRYNRYEKEQSYPVFWDGFFAGIEFPVATTRVENDTVILAYCPGLTAEPNVWYQTRKAVIGVAPKGKERYTFGQYIDAHRPKPRDLHINYNSWWTSSVPFTEKEILGLMDEFEKNLYIQNKVSFDTFTIDLGWSNPKSIWEIDTKLFPDGFTNLESKVKRMKAYLGLWLSPSSQYDQALNNNWAKQNGYETFKLPWTGVCCLGGKRYAEAYKKQAVNLVTKYQIRQLKCDAICIGCTETNHGHAAAPCAADAIAQGAIDAFEAVRKAAPEIWIEACFGHGASPWWIFYVNALTGSYGDDAPYGRVPAPVYRESYTTARDYFNLLGVANASTPISGTYVFGVVHQTNDPFNNDAAIAFMRGQPYMPLYVAPWFMNKERWEDLAGFIKWAKKNEWLYRESTFPLLPVSWINGNMPEFGGATKLVSAKGSMAREPYGYAHWDNENNRGMIALRNPYITAGSYSVKLGEEIGLTKNIKKLSCFSIYPEVRTYGEGLSTGDTITVPVAPYETVVLSIGAEKAPSWAPCGKTVLTDKISVSNNAYDLIKLEFEDTNKPKFGQNYTRLTDNNSCGVEVKLSADVLVNSPQGQVVIILEGKASPNPISVNLMSGGKQIPLDTLVSQSGWGAAAFGSDSAWTILQADLSNGKNHISLQMTLSDDCRQYSVWAVSRKSVKNEQVHANSMPSPEWVYLDSVNLLDSQNIKIAAKTEKKPAPVEQIEGIYLDTLTPESAVQGWGKLQKNKSVKEESLFIAGKRYLRGLGTHAKARIVYDLGGAYSRFESVVGVDCTKRGTVTFEVILDGKKAWESSSMMRRGTAESIDLDVTGINKMELIVGDGGDSTVVDYANWGDAKLFLKGGSEDFVNPY